MVARNAVSRLPSWRTLTGLVRAAAPTGTFAVWCAGACTVTAVLALWQFTRLGGDAVTIAVRDGVLTVTAAAAAVSCLARARATGGATRRSWLLFGGSAAAQSVGQFVWTWYGVTGASLPFPSMADIAFIVAWPLLVAAPLSLPPGGRSRANRARHALDGLLIAGSLLMVSWVVMLRPVVDAGGGAVMVAGSLLYPVGDVVMVTVVVFMLARSRRTGEAPAPLGLLGGALVAFAVADSLFVYNLHAERRLLGDTLDLGWCLGYLLLMLAARKPPVAPPARESRPANLIGPGMPLPYLAVLVALGTSVLELVRTGEVDPFISWNRTAIIVLLVGRQALTLLENHSLTRYLEARVAARTVELQASERRFQALVQHSSDVVTVVDRLATVLYQSESVRRVFGYAAEELGGRPLTLLMDVDSGARLRAALSEVAGQPYGTVVVELIMRHSDGRPRHAEMTITNLLDDAGVGGLVLNTRDISERKELEDQLVHAAFHDSLTGLANRALFTDRVGQALRRRADTRTKVGVLFLDLDGFKAVNDSLGHASGDQLLIQVAERLTAAVRPEDTVARFGGDEFAVLVRDMAGDWSAEEVARRLVEGLRAPFLVEGRELQVKASIGIAVTGLGPGSEDADQLMRNADLAMYQAKAAGLGGFASYDATMQVGVTERLQLDMDLRRALDRGEFELHYQPAVALATGEIVGFEALVRWHHPTRGMVPPAEFIPLAESSGLIRRLGRWALEEACRQTVAWNAARDGRPLFVGVNVSGRQVEQSDLPTVVAMALAATGLPAGQLCLEMSEGVLMNDSEDNLAVLERLKALGVRLAIDDFGTGYTSLSYLHRFPVDVLKIDSSFVERLDHPSEDADLARTIVQLSRNLGMVTVAEGVERHGQVLALGNMACELGQGDHFARPLPADEATLLLGGTLARATPS